MTAYEMLKYKKIVNVYEGRPDQSVLIRLDDRTEIVICAGMIRVDDEQETVMTIEPNAHNGLLAALKDISEMKGMTLLGPDSRHHMGDAATCYHEQGANAAFGQAAEVAAAAIDKAKGESQ